jgi:hypothetical protein
LNCRKSDKSSIQRLERGVQLDAEMIGDGRYRVTGGQEKELRKVRAAT